MKKESGGGGKKKEKSGFFATQGGRGPAAGSQAHCPAAGKVVSLSCSATEGGVEDHYWSGKKKKVEKYASEGRR